MRISTSESYALGISLILDKQSQLAQTQQQLSTGKRIVNPADDPAGAAQALDLQSAIDTNTQYTHNGDAATARLNLEQSALGQVSNALQRVRTLVLQANNDSQTDESRASIASELSQSLKQLVSLGNTRDANGDYIFAGSQTTTQPFSVKPGGGFAYAGDNAQRFLQIDANRTLATNDPGSSVFMQILNGNGDFTATAAATNTGTGVIDPGQVIDASAYTHDTYQLQFVNGNTYNVVDTTTGTTLLSNQTYQGGESISFAGIQTSIKGAPAAGDIFTIAPSQQQDLFQTVQNVIDTLNTPTGSPASLAKLHNNINQGLVALDQGLGRMVNVQAAVGSRLISVQSQQQLQQDWGVQLKTAQSGIQDLDYAKAVSQLNLQLTGLQAAQKTYLQVQGLSLFKYL
jgi:flagellar hook-associated protein 3 FlgL